MTLENEYMKNAIGIGGLANLALTTKFPPRPGHGTQGRKIVVYANYLKVIVKADINLTRYNVDVSPEAAGKKLVRIFQLLLELPEFARVATDGKSMIIAVQPLNVPDGYSVDIVYRAEGHDELTDSAVTYKVRIVTPTSLPVAGLVNYLSNTSPGLDFPLKAEVTQALNTIFGHYPKAHDGTVSIGQNRHFAIHRTSIAFGHLEADSRLYVGIIKASDLQQVVSF